jgi:hypothetical protein
MFLPKIIAGIRNLFRVLLILAHTPLYLITSQAAKAVVSDKTLSKAIVSNGDRSLSVLACCRQVMVELGT